ncbi:MAG: DUF5716 family protein [Defluviitaleaceae bacterium]|nr:DUF5716 family protein [Defluviitaleaceae bacterium]
MHWKTYKNLTPAQKRDEVYYIIGLDVGNDSTGIAFFNVATGESEAIDLSGGYGKPSIPTVMQYIEETREWVFGEYAILNRGLGTELTLSDLVQRLGDFDYIDIAGKPMAVANVLALFLKEILGSVRNINPKAEIVGIVSAVPAYFGDAARQELTRAFAAAGYEKELIALVSDRECVFAHHYARHAPREEYVLLLDYGAREVRGGLYHVLPEGDTLAVESVSSLFDDTIGTVGVVSDVQDLFASFLPAESTVKTPQTVEQITAFVHQNKDMIFQKNIRTKPVQLYFNFTYPPFRKTLTHTDAANLSRPYALQFERFMRDVMQKNLYGEPIRPADISAVLCVGGGFEMLWTRESVTEIFAKTQTHFHKNAKLVTAEGAALVAAQRLDMLDAPNIVLEDRHQLDFDIGLTDSGNFLPLIERNAFWWQKHTDKLILINAAISDLSTLQLQLATRTRVGDIHPLMDVELPGLPKRPKGTTRLGIGLDFTSNAEAIMTVRDVGFGELFQSCDFCEEYEVELA